jgi:AcrR family transcriptional regulator
VTAPPAAKFCLRFNSNVCFNSRTAFRHPPSKKDDLVHIADTKERLLDAAEKLFAEKGYHCTSLRLITQAAQVNLAAVNYHFGSKESLLTAVLERRLLPLNELRFARLRQVLSTAQMHGRRPSVREALAAFIEPTIHYRTSGPGADYFVTLVGRALAEPDETVRTIFLDLLAPLFNLLFDILGQAYPELPRQQLFWRLTFTLGAISHSMCTLGRFRLIPPGIDPQVDEQALVSQLLDFLTTGMEAP